MASLKDINPRLDFKIRECCRRLGEYGKLPDAPDVAICHEGVLLFRRLLHAFPHAMGSAMQMTLAKDEHLEPEKEN